MAFGGGVGERRARMRIGRIPPVAERRNHLRTLRRQERTDDG